MKTCTFTVRFYLLILFCGNGSVGAILISASRNLGLVAGLSSDWACAEFLLPSRRWVKCGSGLQVGPFWSSAFHLPDTDP